MTPWLTVIGIGEDGIYGLPAIHRATIAAAELIIGGERHLALLGAVKAETQSWASPLSRTVEEILKRRGRRVVAESSRPGAKLPSRVGARMKRWHMIWPQPWLSGRSSGSTPARA